jgi:hypothetical protein
MRSEPTGRARFHTNVTELQYFSSGRGANQTRISKLHGLDDGADRTDPCPLRWSRFRVLGRFQAKWEPVRARQTPKIRNPEPRFNSIETEKATGVDRNHMFRIIVLSAITVLSVRVSAANAESRSPGSPRSPGEIAAASRLIAERHESCRLEARQQKLTFFKRRSFFRKCMKSRP